MELHTKRGTVQTNATGSLFTVLATKGTIPCSAVRLHNNTGTPLEVKIDDDTSAFVPVQDKDRSALFFVTDPNRVSVRRIDQSNTQVTAVWEALSF